MSYVFDKGKDYSIINFTKKYDYDGKVEYEFGKVPALDSTYKQGITLKSLEDAHTVARLAGFKVYAVMDGSFEYSFEKAQENEVYCSKSIKVWRRACESRNMAGDEDNKRLEDLVNGLPKQVTIYNDKEIKLYAEKDKDKVDFSDGHNCSDLRPYHYELRVLEGSKWVTLGGCGWSRNSIKDYRQHRSGFRQSSKPHYAILRSKFAADILYCEKVKSKAYKAAQKLSWHAMRKAEADALKPTAQEVKDYGEILELILAAFDAHIDKTNKLLYEEDAA